MSSIRSAKQKEYAEDYYRLVATKKTDRQLLSRSYEFKMAPKNVLQFCSTNVLVPMKKILDLHRIDEMSEDQVPVAKEIFEFLSAELEKVDKQKEKELKTTANS